MIRQLIVTILFVGLLMGPVLYRWAGVRSDPAAANASAQSSLVVQERHGCVLREASRRAGIVFTHQPPEIDERLHHILPQVAAMGAAVSVVDFDRDGWHDFYVANSAPGSHSGLFRNRQNGTFVDVAREVGLADVNAPGTGACMGSVWADMDNDGYEDVLIYKWGRCELYRNLQGTSFERITDQANLPAWANIGAATWLDYDRDGLLDLFLAGYWADDVRLSQLTSTRIMPESFEYANNGGSKWLLKNRGGGHFEDVTAAVGIDSHRWTLAVVAADFNDDGYPDLFLANDYGLSEMYLNEQGRGFRERGRQLGVGFAPKSGMNAAVGDVLNRGELAIYETNISEPGVLIQGNNLWMPKGNGESLRFENMASVMGVELGGWSFGAQFGDLNNDGYVDLYLTNGYASGKEGTSYWYDFSQIAGGHSNIIADAANWPAMRDRSLAGYQRKCVWLNDGLGRFDDVAEQIGVTDTYDGRGVALIDVSNDGALDVLVANQRGPLLLYENRVDAARHWIGVRLEGRASNRSAIGTQVLVSWNGQQQLQELVAASGYAAQNQRVLHFGLGDCDRVDRIVIRWPSGKRQTVENPGIDQIHDVRESL